MRKIPNVFMRDWGGDKSRVLREVEPASAWVLAGDGRATRKRDGTSCLWSGGKLWKRYDARRGKTPPANFVAAQEPDPVTGHAPGWLPVSDEPGDWAHRAALFLWPSGWLEGATYELCGPKVQGNPEGLGCLTFFRHGEEDVDFYGLSFDGIAAWLDANPMEGIVWHHPDGRMAKVKRRDFGLEWPVRGEGPASLTPDQSLVPALEIPADSPLSADT